MAELPQGRVDILSRENGALISQSSTGYSHTVHLTQSSVVRINGTRAMVVQYEHQGDDLILHMRDGSVVRYQKFFFDDVKGEHSQLVFDDGVNPTQHALFPGTAESTGLAAVPFTPTYESLDSVQPLLLADSSGISAGVVAASALGVLGLAGVAIAAKGGGGGNTGRGSSEENAGNGDNGGENTATPGAPAVTINAFAGDDILDNSEKQTAQLLSGNTHNVEAGQSVTVSLNDQTYTATVKADGSWNVAVPASALAALPAGKAVITVNVSDAAGIGATNTHDFTVQPPVGMVAPVIAIDTFAGDDVLDMEERNTAQILSGSTSNVEAGQMVTITVNAQASSSASGARILLDLPAGEQTFNATVGTDGRWSITIPPEMLQSLPGGPLIFTASVTNTSGLSTSDVHSAMVAMPPESGEEPVVSVAPFTGDGVLSPEERTSDQTLSGSTSGVAEGQIVTVTLNEQSFSTAIDTNGNWSVTVPAGVLNSLEPGNVTLNVNVTTATGDTLNSDYSFLVVTPAAMLPTLVIDPLTGDDYLDRGEKNLDQILSGSATGVQEGDLVTLTLNGQAYSTTINADGTWERVLPAAVFQAMDAGEYTLAVSVTSTSGETATATLNLTVAASAPQIIVDLFSGDGILDAGEMASGVTLSGTTVNVEAGRQVTVTLAEETYSGTVGIDGRWSISLPSDALGMLDAGAASLVVIVTSAAGEEATQQINFTVEPATPQPDSPAITLDNIAGDNVLDNGEKTSDQTISGTTTGVENGQTVTLTLNGQSWSSAVNADGNWSIVVPATALQALPAGEATFAVSVSNQSGGVTTAEQVVDIAIPQPTIRVDALTDDGVLDPAEAAATQTLTGSTSNVSPGAVITLTLNDQSYSGMVDSEGTWSIELPSTFLTTLAAGINRAVLTVSNDAGEVSSDYLFTVSAETPADQPAISVNIFTNDDVLDIGEKASDQLLSGTTENIEAGAIVTITLNGNLFYATVGNNGNWSTTIPAEALQALGGGTATFGVAVTSGSGETATAVHDFNVNVSSLTVSIDTPFGDGYLNRDESDSAQTLTGTTGAIGEGQQVIVNLNGTDYTATVNDNGNWSLTLSRDVVSSLPSGITPVVVTVTDAAGNRDSAQSYVNVDRTPPTVTVDAIGGDNVINSIEVLQDVPVSGTASVEDRGQAVTVTFNNQTYTTQVLSDGRWVVSLPASAMAGLPDGDYRVGVSLTDAAGNTTTAAQTLSRQASPDTLPTLTIDEISDDNIINRAEAGDALIVSGSSTSLEPGRTVTVTLNGKSYSGTIGDEGEWRVTVPQPDVAALADGQQVVVVVTTDTAGNPASNSSSFMVLAGDASQPTLTLDAIAADNVVNHSEAGSDLLISGSSTRLATGTPITVALNGENYNAVVDEEGNWQLSVPQTVVATLPQGPLEINVSASDVAGNPAAASREIMINSGQPALTDITLSSGDTLNHAEALTGLTVSGASEQGITVSVTLNEVTYTTTAGNNGAWSLTIPTAALQQLPDGDGQIDISVVDTDGNTQSTSVPLSVAIHTLPALTVAMPFGDGVLNAAEAAEPLALSGRADNLDEGTPLTITLGDLTFTTAVDAQGEWHLTLPANALAALPDGVAQLTVSGSDPAGNPAVGIAAVEVLMTLPSAATIAASFGDGVINISEATTGQTISGSAALDDGQILSVRVDDTTLYTHVNPDGSWTATLPSDVINALGSGAHTITATVTDRAGNSRETSQNFTSALTELTPPTLDIAFGDNRLNASEAQQGATLSGTTGIENAISLVVTLNGVNYDAQIATDGRWSVALTAEDLANLPDGNQTIAVTVTDSVGNTAAVSSPLLVAIHVVPDVTFNLPFGNGALDAQEATLTQTLSGTTGVSGADQTVRVLISGLNNDRPFTAVVDANGNWTLDLEPDTLRGLENGTHTITVTATDAAGNVDDAVQTMISGVIPPDPTFDADLFGGDDVLNRSEAANPAGMTLTGTTGGVGDNQAVRITIDLNGTTYSGTVDAQGNWSVNLPSAVLISLSDSEHTLNLTVTDATGNTASESYTFTADLTPPLPGIDAQYDGAFINRDAVESDGYLLQGTAGEGATTVTLTLGGETYDADVSNGRWSLQLTPAELQLLTEGDNALTVTATDSAGNSANASGNITVDTVLPGLTLLPFTGDDALSYKESLQVQTLSGSVTDAQVGASVTVSIDQTVLGTATVGSDGQWSLVLTPSQLATFTSPITTLDLHVTDLAGNVINDTRTINVDLTPPENALVTLGPVSDDNVISSQDEETLNLSGSYARLGDGGAVTVNINGRDYTTVLDADTGSWSANVARADFGEDGIKTITVTASGAEGNDSVTGTVRVDLTPPQLTLNAFTGDNVINFSETQSNQIISGTASVSEAGRNVEVTLNGTVYRALVQENGSWSATLPAADLQALQEGGSYDIVARLSDAAGNVTTQTENLTVDKSAPLIQVDALLGDNLINLADAQVDQVLTGHVTGANGQTIALFVGGGNPVATALVQPDGSFSFDLSSEYLLNLADGALVFGLRVADPAGNATDATLTVNKFANSLLGVHIDSVFGDGLLSAVDAAVVQNITGTAVSAAGGTVSVLVGSQMLTSTVSQDGRWTIGVPVTALQALADGTMTLTVSVTDTAGNVAQDSADLLAIINALPAVNAPTDLFGGDNLLNIAESLVPDGQTIGGTITNGTAGSAVTVTLGGHSYSTILSVDGSWSLNLPQADLATLLNGNLTLGISVTDPVGNIASNSTTLGVFTQQPTLTLTSLFGDGVLNFADIAAEQTISGVVNHVAPGATVTVSLGDSTLTAQVDENGAFTAAVPPSVLATLAQGNLTVGFTLADSAGNSATATAGARVDTLVPSVSLGRLFGDGLLSAADALVSQVISGTTENAGAGSRVVISVAAQQFLTTTDDSGNFSVTLSPATLQSIADGDLTVRVEVTDSAGNTGSATASALTGIHNLPQITLAPLFGDGALNLAESLVTQTVSGVVSHVALGTTVQLTIGTYSTTATVGADGAFSTQLLPAVLGTLLDSRVNVSATVTDTVGNTATTTSAVTVAIGNQPTLALNTLFGDGVLSAGDLNSNQIISGTSTNLTAGTVVTATLNGKTYSGQVSSGNVWSISVPKTDLAAITDGNQTISVTASDTWGNPARDSGNLSVISHTPPVVAITSLFGDNALSVVDVRTAQTISGTASNAEGSTVSVTLGSQTWNTTVNANGSWSLAIPAASLAAIADGSYTVTASVTNAAGVSGSGSSALAVVSHTTPTVSLNSYFGDDGYLNIAEAGAAEIISGSSTNAAGGSVQVNVAGILYTTAVGSNGNWSVTVPAGSLQTIADGSYPLNVTVTDTGGNTATTSSSFTVLSHNAPVVGVDPVLSVVSSLLTGLVVQGGSLNAAQGAKVTVTLLLGNGNNGPSLSTTTDALGRYAVNFSPSLLSVGGLLLSLSTLAKVTLTDVAGNSYTTTNTLLLGALLPVATTASTESVMLLSADDDSTAGNAVHSDSQHSNTVTAADETSDTSTVVSTLTTDADASAVSTTAATPTTAVAESTDDAGYTIGGVTITLADGSVVEGATVTGSTGDDSVTVSNLNFTHIDGGTGTDTLVLNGEHLTLDLTSTGQKVEHIEVLDLGLSGNNAIRLDLNEALNLTDKPEDDLLIKGAEGSQVTLATPAGAVWEITGERMVNGEAYEIYHNTALSSDNTLGDVLIQHNLQVHMA